MHTTLARLLSRFFYALILAVAPFSLEAQELSAYTLTDTIQARYYLQQAQQQLDSFRYEAALASARQAEPIFEELFGPKNSRMADVYALLGLCCLKAKPKEAAIYYQKIIEMEWPASGLSRAHLFFFKGVFLHSAGEEDAALQAYRDALGLYLKQPGTPHGNTARIYNNAGIVLAGKGQYEEALKHYQLALELWHRIHGPMHPNLAHAYNNRGLVYADQAKYDIALDNYAQALYIREKCLGNNHPEVAATRINIGLVYAAKRDLGRAAGHFYSALEIILKTGTTAYLPFAYTNIGLIHSGKQEHDIARAFFEKSLAVEQTLYPPGHPQLALTYFNIGATYKDQGQYDNAEKYYQKALDIATEENTSLGTFYNGLGLICQEKGKYEQAETWYQKALDRQTALFGRRHPTVANAYYNLARLRQAEGRLPEALDYNQQAQESLGYRSGQSIEGVSSPFELCQVMSQENRLLGDWARQAGQPEAMNKMRESCARTLDIFSKLGSSYIDPSSRQELMGAAFSSFEAAIAANMGLAQLTANKQYQTDAFEYAERSKALLLYEAIREAEALKIAGIPDSLLQQEKNLRLDIAAYDKLRQEKLAGGLSETDTSVLAIAASLLRLRQSHETLKSRFEEEYPKYYRARYELPILKVDEVQQELLKPGQSLVEYFVGDSAVYIFLLQPDHFEVVEVKKDSSLEAWVRLMTQEGTYGYYSLPRNEQSFSRKAETIHNYTIAARKLYDKLWAPIKDKLTEQVIVIPDGPLGYLPFEALLSREPPREGAFNEYPYLLYEHQFSYCYSATLLREMQEKPFHQPAEGLLLAMAPFYTDDVELLAARMDSLSLKSVVDPEDVLEPLPGSGEEINQINRLWKGKALYGPQASLEKFLLLAPKHLILHLSTHGRADDRLGDYAYLAFGVPGQPGAFDKLYARDLYNLSLDADLVFLSACETGIGKLRRGEGIVSLARAFAYAGTKSVVTTLWQVRDKETQSLATSFYTYLHAGKSKDAALRLAKLEYLEQQQGQGTEALAHPFFWSGFIGIGDMNSLKNGAK